MFCCSFTLFHIHYAKYTHFVIQDKFSLINTDNEQERDFISRKTTYLSKMPIWYYDKVLNQQKLKVQTEGYSNL